MVEVFRAIGFDIADEASYNRLAELAEARGEHTRIFRRGSTIHGRCWRIGHGVEVWTVLRESKEGLVYADCRPAFRPRHMQNIGSWELVEYDEDGEAVLEGRLVRGGLPVSFELQNLTELENATFAGSELPVALAGLAYSLKRVRGHSEIGLRPSDRPNAIPPPDGSDHVAVARVVRSSVVVNPETGTELVWVFADIGGAPLEVISRPTRGARNLQMGDLIETEVWLQGYVFGERAARARYEGVDPDWQPAASWSLLRKGN